MAQGKGSRAKTRDRRSKERRAKKESMQAQYRQWAVDGANQKSGRFQRKGQMTLRHRAQPKINPVTLSNQVYLKLLELSGVPGQFTGRAGSEISAYIRRNWDNLEQAWAAHGIVPVRSDIPFTYQPQNWEGSF